MCLLFYCFSLFSFYIYLWEEGNKHFCWKHLICWTSELVHPSTFQFCCFFCRSFYKVNCTIIGEIIHGLCPSPFSRLFKPSHLFFLGLGAPSVYKSFYVSWYSFLWNKTSSPPLHLPNCFQYLQSCLKLSIKEQLISLGFSFLSLNLVTLETCQHPVAFSPNNKVTLYLPPSSFRLNSDAIYVIFT